MEKIKLLFVIISVFILNTTRSQTPDIGDIPQSRMSASGWEDIKFDESGTWTTVDVTTKGVVPNTGADMGPAIQSMIMAGSGKTIYKFPAGKYYINTLVRISKSDFQIIGEGSSTKFLLKGGANPPMIVIAGARDGAVQRLQTAIKRGDNKITLKSVAGFAVGDFIFIRQANGERSYDIDTQLVEILDIDGNTVTIDMKMGLPFAVDKASVQKCTMLKNIKLSQFYAERLTEPDVKEAKFRLSNIYNGEVSHVESNKTLGQHFEINDCRNVLLFQNNIYGNFGHDKSGGYQGGIVLNRSTRINIINNRFHDLRHHVAMQFGSNHCVIAYNRTTKYNHYSDYGQHNNKGCHNNLFEGNFGSELYDDWNKKAWGSPYAMWFRNHAIIKIGTEYLGQSHMSIIGNELEADASGLKLAAPENDNYVAANIVSISKENGIGKMLWGDLDSSKTIPNSLFLTEKPDYLPSWPLYGPGVAEIDTTSISTPDTITDTAGEYTLIWIEAQQEPNLAVNMFDGNTTDDSRWSAEGFPKSVMLDLGEEKEIIGTNVWTYQSRAYQYKIELSNSASDGFTTLVERISNTSTGQPIADNFSKQSGRYVKLTVVGCYNYTGAWASLTELEFVFNDGSSSLSANEELLEFDVYPNPSSGQFSIALNSINEGRVQIYNINGKQVYDKPYSQRSINLPQGIYIIKLTAEDEKTYHRQIIIQ